MTTGITQNQPNNRCTMEHLNFAGIRNCRLLAGFSYEGSDKQTDIRQQLPYPKMKGGSLC
jgi:hypothetical protein